MNVHILVKLQFPGKAFGKILKGNGVGFLVTLYQGIFTHSWKGLNKDVQAFFKMGD